MRINFFEGARRIALLTAALWSIGVVAYNVSEWERDTRVKLVFAVRSPDLPATRTTPSSTYLDCEFSDAEESRELVTPSGTPLTAWLCFKASRFKNGEMLVPYKDNRDGTWLGARRWSSDVKAYTKEVAGSFRLSKDDQEWADTQLWPTRWRKLGEVTSLLLGGLLAIWAFTAIVGWIVRGFIGIPRGKDFREKQG